MTDFQIVIASSKIKSDVKDRIDDDIRFDVRQNSLVGDRAIAKIDELAEIWDDVVERLTVIAAKTKDGADKSPYELDSIEFNIGIEAGLSVGLVTKANASVSVAFKKRIAKIKPGE